MEEQKEIKLYNFDPKTKEYTGFSLAEKDPAESEIQNRFVPLVSAYATLIQPPECGENEVPVYSSSYEEQEGQTKILVENWTIEKDYRRTHYTVDDDFNVKEIKEIGDIGGYVVTKEMGEDIKQNPSHYKIIENEIVKKTEEEISSEKIRKEKERKSMLSLTAADVERALYKTKGIDFEDIIRLVEETNTKIDSTQSALDTAQKELEEIKAGLINNESEETPEQQLKNALKNAKTKILIEDAEDKITKAKAERNNLPKEKIDIKSLKIELKANNFYRGNPYVEQIGTLLGYSTEDIDYLFENKELPGEG